MSLWLLIRLGHLLFHLAIHPLLLATTFCSGKKLPQPTHSDSLKKLFPSTGNTEGNDLRDPEAKKH